MNILTSLLYGKDEETRLKYQEMTELSINSFKENLSGEWEHRQVDVPYNEDIDQIFYKNFKQLYKWWQEGHNVFYVNIDMLCVKPTEVFGLYDKLTMFWQTDPPSTKRFPTNFNCAVMYIPKETKQEVWDYGFEKYREYFDGERVGWAADQDIFNEMLYHQGEQPETYLDNKLHYLAHPNAEELNEITEDEAHIVHYFSTRGFEEALERMKNKRR